MTIVDDDDDEGSSTSSSDTLNFILEEQDIIISDLRDEIEVLKRRIEVLKSVIQIKLPLYLQEVM